MMLMGTFALQQLPLMTATKNPFNLIESQVIYRDAIGLADHIIVVTTRSLLFFKTKAKKEKRYIETPVSYR